MLQTIKISSLILFLFSVAQAQKTCVVRQDEVEVYRVVLKSADEQSIVESRPERAPATLFDLGRRQLQDAAAGWKPRLEAAPAGSVTILPSPPPDFTPIPVSSREEIQQDYQKKMGEHCRIPQIGIPSVKVVEESELKAPAHVKKPDDPSLYWKWFHDRFGAKAARTALSRVAFDKSRTFAVVHVSSGSGHDAVLGTLYVLRHGEKGWSILRSYPTWGT